MKTVALLLGSLSMMAAAPSTSSAGLFSWYDGWYDSGWYGTGYRGWGYSPYSYGAYYGPPSYQTALYSGGWDCGCNACCAPCNPCGVGGCNPCGTGGCGPGGCQWNAPAGNPAPIPDSNIDRPETDAPPARPRTRTYETEPENGSTFESPSRGSSGSDRSSPSSRFRDNRSTPADDGTLDRFKPRDSSGTGTGTPRENDPGASGSGTGASGDSTKDFGAEPSSIDSNKPILGEGIANPQIGNEIVIPQQKPADIAPIDEGNTVKDGGTLDSKTTSKPVVELHRMALRANFASPKLVRTHVRPATEWSVAPTDARIAQH